MNFLAVQFLDFVNTFPYELKLEFLISNHLQNTQGVKIDDKLKVIEANNQNFSSIGTINELVFPTFLFIQYLYNDICIHSYIIQAIYDSREQLIK